MFGGHAFLICQHLLFFQLGIKYGSWRTSTRLCTGSFPRLCTGIAVWWWEMKDLYGWRQCEKSVALYVRNEWEWECYFISTGSDSLSEVSVKSRVKKESVQVHLDPMSIFCPVHFKPKRDRRNKYPKSVVEWRACPSISLSSGYFRTHPPKA